MRLDFLHRKTNVPSLIMAAVITASSVAASEGGSTCNGFTIYEGGSVWNGDSFEIQDIAILDGVFVEPDPPCECAKKIDVRGKFLTPPYGNAHHHITGDRDDVSWAFMEHGVFYVWNPTLLSTTYTPEEARYYSRKDTYDVRVAMGAITEPGGHPEKLYVDTLSQFVYPGKGFDYFYGAAFHYGRTHEEIDSVLDLLVEQGAQFIKIMLLYSEEYQDRKNDNSYYGLKGIDPSNMPYLVSAAHERGRTVAVHVETQHDALTAARAGADMLAHLPGYLDVDDHSDLERIVLSGSDAREIAENGVVVVPTYALTTYRYSNKNEGDRFDQALPARHYEVQAANLRFLSEANVTILTGTDSYPYIYDEAAHWVEIGGLSIKETLRAVYQTGRYLFSDRKIGYIDVGYEADLLVLSANPLDDLDNLSAIEMRIKGGQLMTEPK